MFIALHAHFGICGRRRKPQVELYQEPWLGVFGRSGRISCLPGLLPHLHRAEPHLVGRLPVDCVVLASRRKISDVDRPG